MIFRALRTAFMLPILLVGFIFLIVLTGALAMNDLIPFKWRPIK